MNDFYAHGENMRFCFPADGDCLNVFDGEEKDGVLKIKVRLYCRGNADIYVNGQKTFIEDGYRCAFVDIVGRETVLTASNRSGRDFCRIKVYRLNDPVNRFRISSDDNILFLRNITDKQNEYKSVFEDPYLGVYKKAHDEYGAKVHINLFREFDKEAASHFTSKEKYFDLSMMTDKFKDEFAANSDWLKFSFHAKKEFPDRPYEHASFDEVYGDVQSVHKEIIRFAGKDSLSDVCTLHWGSAEAEGVRALRRAGYRGLAGYFDIMKNGKPLVSYFYPVELVNHIGGRDFWKDTREDVIYGKVDAVLNLLTPDEVVPKLERILSDPHKSGFVSLLIHEQYFYPGYVRYIPDFEKIVLTACDFLTKRGYRGSLMSEVMFGNENRETGAAQASRH